MDISIIGSGYVGLVSAACFSSVGNRVVCVDIDQQKIDQLNRGEIPIYEPGLEEIVAHGQRKERLKFTSDITEAVTHASVIFICVGTPQSASGQADLQYVLEAAKSIGKNLVKPLIVITKSTVPVGTGDLVRKTVNSAARDVGKDIPIEVVSNPEFLREGNAVKDFLEPDRVVIGADTSEARTKILDLYLPFIKDESKILTMGLTAAELTKYAANCFLATKISFMNEIANVCDHFGANVDEVRKGIGTDKRIGPLFLNAGIGYGGSCFPKDVKALIHTAGEVGANLQIIKAADEVNDRQKKKLIDKMHSFYNGNLQGKTFAVWGLAFKSQTDDMREASSIATINALLECGCRVKATDPAAIQTAKTIWPDTVTFYEDMYETLRDADALLILTEWEDFLRPSFERMKQLLKEPVIFDGRNIYNFAFISEQGMNYISIGRPEIGAATSP